MHASTFRNILHVVRDGQEAIDFLYRQGSHSAAIRPDLILLDLNLPKLGGHAVLDKVKKDPDLRRIPIIMLTTSSTPEDIGRSYDLHANAYVSKPINFDDFTEAIRQIDDFFTRTSPPHPLTAHRPPQTPRAVAPHPPLGPYWRSGTLGGQRRRYPPRTPAVNAD